MELTLGENYEEVSPDVLVAIAKDCVKYKWKRGAGCSDSHTFNSAENRRYRAIEAASTGHGFWGGYSYLDDEVDLREGYEFWGVIHLYGPQRSGKWSFGVRNGKFMICCA